MCVPSGLKEGHSFRRSVPIGLCQSVIGFAEPQANREISPLDSTEQASAADRLSVPRTTPRSGRHRHRRARRSDVVRRARFDS